MDQMIESRKQFGRLLRSKSLNGIGVEVGVLRGEFSKNILDTSDLSILISVDIWENKEEEGQALRTLSQYGNRSIQLKGESHTVSQMFPECIFDFIYIDAAHDQESVQLDLESWWPKLKSGGLFAGHDYAHAVVENGKFVWPYGELLEVIEPVNEFSDKHGMIVQTTNETYFPSWYFFKDKIKLI